MMRFVTKVLPIIIIDLVSVELLCKLTENVQLVIQGPTHTYSHHRQKQFQKTKL